MLGAIVPARTWFGAVMSILGVALLESSGSPPSVRVFLIMSCFSVRISFLVHLMTNQLYASFKDLKLNIAFIFVLIICSLTIQVGDLLNFLSAVFFGIHMLRTEHISRSTNKKDFLPLLGYEVSIF